MKKTQVELESRVIVGAHGVSAEEDHIKIGKVVGVGVVALVIFAVGCVWAWRLQVTTEAELQPDGPPARPAALGQYEIGIVNQRMFEQDFHADLKIGDQHDALERGWGEQRGVVAHLPLEQAMNQVIAETERARRAPAPAPEPTPPPTTPVVPPPSNPTAPAPNPPPTQR